MRGNVEILSITRRAHYFIENTLWHITSQHPFGGRQSENISNDSSNLCILNHFTYLLIYFMQLNVQKKVCSHPKMSYKRLKGTKGDVKQILKRD